MNASAGFDKGGSSFFSGAAPRRKRSTELPDDKAIDMLAYKKVLKGEEGRAEMQQAGRVWINDLRRRLLEIGMDDLTSDLEVSFAEKMQKLVPDPNPLLENFVVRCKEMMLTDSDDE